MTQRNRAMGRGILVSLGEIFRMASTTDIMEPPVQQSIRNLAETMTLLFETRAELGLKLRNGVFYVEDSMLLEESLFMMDMVKGFEAQKVAGIFFYPGIHPDEITPLVKFLLGKTDVANVMMGLSMARSANSHIQLIFQEGIENIAPHNRLDRQQTRYRQLLRLTEECFSRLVNEQAHNFHLIETALDEIIDDVFENASSFVAIINRHKEGALLPRHAVDTAIYSIFIGHQLDLEAPALRQLALAGLLHDMGRMLLPTEFKTGYKLKDRDAEFVQSHVKDGASFLAGVSELPPIVFRVALEHHWAPDGHGYPAFPSGYTAHLYSQIVGLADFMSWRTVSEKEYHRPVALDRLVRVLLRRAGSQFNPYLVKLFIPLFGFYPSGTQVRLADGREAVVEEAVFHNILRPWVTLKNAPEPKDIIHLEQEMLNGAATAPAPLPKIIKGPLNS